MKTDCSNDCHYQSDVTETPVPNPELKPKKKTKDNEVINARRKKILTKMMISVGLAPHRWILRILNDPKNRIPR